MLLLFGDVIEPLALFELDDECLCPALADVGPDDEDVVDVEDVETAVADLEEEPDVEFDSLPLLSLSGLNTLDVDLSFDVVVPPPGVCDDVESPERGWRSFSFK